MCLLLNPQQTETMRAALRAGTLTVWKTYHVGGNDCDKLYAPYQHIEVVPNGDGVVHSNRHGVALTQGEEASLQVERGIHVNIVRNSPQYASSSVSGTQIVLKVTVDPDDFVGCDAEGAHAVFMKIRVNPDDVTTLCQKVKERLEEDDEEDEDVCPECGDPYCDGECEDDDDDDDFDDDEELDDDDDWEDEDDDYDDDDEDEEDDDYDDYDDEDDDWDELDDEV